MNCHWCGYFFEIKKNSSPVWEFFNGGPSRQDFEQFQSEIEKSPLISTIDCISLYQSISKDFFNKWESVLTDRQKFIYRR